MCEWGGCILWMVILGRGKVEVRCGSGVRLSTRHNQALTALSSRSREVEKSSSLKMSSKFSRRPWPAML
jgi:hypothetical protein